MNIIHKCESCSMDATYQKNIDGTMHYYCDHHKSNDAIKIVGVEKQSLFNELIPLFSVFAAVTIMSFVIQLDQTMNWMKFMMDWMGIFFIVFGGLKLIDLKGFAVGFASYDEIAKRYANYGYVYPFIEIILGILYLFGYMFLWQNLLVLFLAILGMYSAYKVIANKDEIRCVCLGTLFHIPMTWATFIENGLMFLMVVVMMAMPMNMGSMNGMDMQSMGEMKM